METLGIIFGSREWRIKNPMYVLMTVDGSEIRRSPFVVHKSNEIRDILDINWLAGFLPSTGILRINLCVPGPSKRWHQRVSERLFNPTSFKVEVSPLGRCWSTAKINAYIGCILVPLTAWNFISNLLSMDPMSCTGYIVFMLCFAPVMSCNRRIIQSAVSEGSPNHEISSGGTTRLL